MKNQLLQDADPVGLPSKSRIRLGLVTTMLGLLLVILGTKPEWFGVDRGAEVGFVQIAVILVGIGAICLGGGISLSTFWKEGGRTIAADIGSRLVATGYVAVFYVSMADIFGITQTYAKTRYFGPWQAVGIQIGEAVIVLGFLLLIPYRPTKKITDRENG